MEGGMKNRHFLDQYLILSLKRYKKHMWHPW